MCLVSNVGDYWGKQFPEKWPQIAPAFPKQWHDDPVSLPSPPPHIIMPQVSREEFAALKKEVEELKKILLAAKRFDEATGQPHCHMDAKVALIKAVAHMVGVDMKDVFEEGK